MKDLFNAMNTSSGLPGLEQAIMQAMQVRADPAGDVETKDFAKMAGGDRTKLALVKDAWDKIQSALPALFEINEDGSLGDFRETAALPGILGGDPQAYKRFEMAADRLIRLVSGAAVPVHEIEQMQAQSIPRWYRSDETNQQKISDLENYVKTLHSAQTGGYKDVPPELQLEDAYEKWKRENGAK